MRRLALAVVLAGLLAPAVQAQNADLYDLYQKRDLQGCLDGALPRLAQTPDDRDLNHLVGRCLVEIGRPGEARPYLEKVVGGPGQKDWRYAFAFLNLGIVQWWAEDREAARATWTTAMNDPQLSTVARSAQTNLAMSGLADVYAEWTEVAGKHIHCRFAPGVAASDHEAFVQKGDAAWERLAAFFGGQPDRVAEVLVWRDADTAAEFAGVPVLGYTFAELWVVHSLAALPLGRDLAPLFVRWVSRPTEPARFFTEGVAEICDGDDGSDRLAAARAALVAAQITEVDIPRWWQDHRTIPWTMLSPCPAPSCRPCSTAGAGRISCCSCRSRPTCRRGRSTGRRPWRPSSRSSPRRCRPVDPGSAAQLHPQQPRRRRADRGDQEPAHEARRAAHHLLRAEDRTDDLAGAHRQADREHHRALRREQHQRRQVAGEIHHLGRRGGAAQVEPRETHQRHRPERPGARPEEPIVKAEDRARGRLEHRRPHACARGTLAERRRREGVDEDGREQPGDQPAERRRRDALQDQVAQRRARRP